MIGKFTHWILSILSFVGILTLLILQFNKKEKDIVFIDTPKLVAGYQGMIVAKNEYKKKAAAWSANIDTLQNEVNQVISEYQQTKGSLSSKEKALQEELIRTKQQQLAQYKEAIANKAQLEDTKMTQEVINEINAYIRAYGQRKGYDIIIGATQVGNLAYAKQSLDITDDLLKELNGGE